MVAGAWPRMDWKQAACVAVAAIGLANSGCLFIAAGAAAGGAVGYAYGKGKVCQNYSASFEDSWAASQTALRELGMPIEKEERHPNNGFIQSRTTAGDSVRIYLEVDDSPQSTDGPQTCVGVRVATFGDYDLSERILNQVGAHLVLAPSPGTPPPPTAALGPIQPPPPPALPQTAPPPLLPLEPVKISQPGVKAP